MEDTNQNFLSRCSFSDNDGEYRFYWKKRVCYSCKEFKPCLNLEGETLPKNTNLVYCSSHMSVCFECIKNSKPPAV